MGNKNSKLPEQLQKSLEDQEKLNGDEFLIRQSSSSLLSYDANKQMIFSKDKKRVTVDDFELKTMIGAGNFAKVSFFAKYFLRMVKSTPHL